MKNLLTKFKALSQEEKSVWLKNAGLSVLSYAFFGELSSSWDNTTMKPSITGRFLLLSMYDGDTDIPVC